MLFAAFDRVRFYLWRPTDRILSKLFRAISLQNGLGMKFGTILSLLLELSLTIYKRVTLSSWVHMVKRVKLLIRYKVVIKRLFARALGQVVELLLVAQDLSKLLLPFRKSCTSAGLFLMLELWLLISDCSN